MGKGGDGETYVTEPYGKNTAAVSYNAYIIPKL